MKNLMLCLCLAIMSPALFAQSSNSILKVDAQLAITPYGSYKAGGGLVQYDYLLGERWTLSTAAGFTARTFTESGRQRGGVFNGPRWDTTYQYDLKEQVAHFDMHFLYSFKGNSAKSNFKMGLGLSGLLIRFYHPEELLFSEGVIVDRTYKNLWTPAVMANFVLDYDYQLSERWVLHLKAIARISLERHSPAETRAQSEPIGIVSITRYEVFDSPAVSIGMGYRL